MQQNLTSITLGGSSHIGSAAYYLGKSSNEDEVLNRDLMRKQNVQEVQQFSGARSPSLQQREEFTTPGSITNLMAPVDIVLNWLQLPSDGRGQLDLDSHLTGPTSFGADSSVRFHTRFDARGDLNTAPYVELYRDVVPQAGGLGPEQTRIQVLQDGVYRFYVHDYTNRDTIDSSGLAQSGAAVTVHNGLPGPVSPGRSDLGAALGGAINVPVDRLGNVWYVFQLDSRTGILKRVNVPFGNVPNRVNVPSVGEETQHLIR